MLQLARFLWWPKSGECWTRSKTKLVAKACTLLFWISERMSLTFTTQSMLSKTKTNFLPLLTCSTAWSRKWPPISSNSGYFLDLSKQIPYLQNLWITYKGVRQFHCQTLIHEMVLCRSQAQCCQFTEHSEWLNNVWFSRCSLLKNILESRLFFGRSRPSEYQLALFFTFLVLKISLHDFITQIIVWEIWVDKLQY